MGYILNSRPVDALRIATVRHVSKTQRLGLTTTRCGNFQPVPTKGILIIGEFPTFPSWQFGDWRRASELLNSITHCPGLDWTILPTVPVGLLGVMSNKWCLCGDAHNMRPLHPGQESNSLFMLATSQALP